jgi:hypothetical protein
MLVVSTLTQACLNFDGRRAAGNQVLLFSCGGRADGGESLPLSRLCAVLTPHRWRRHRLSDLRVRRIRRTPYPQAAKPSWVVSHRKGERT